MAHRATHKEDGTHALLWDLIILAGGETKEKAQQHNSHTHTKRNPYTSR